MDARRAHADALRYQGVAFECVAIKTAALCCVVAICIHIKDYYCPMVARRLPQDVVTNHLDRCHDTVALFLTALFFANTPWHSRHSGSLYCMTVFEFRLRVLAVTTLSHCSVFSPCTLAVRGVSDVG